MRRTRHEITSAVFVLEVLVLLTLIKIAQSICIKDILSIILYLPCVCSFGKGWKYLQVVNVYLLSASCNTSFIEAVFFYYNYMVSCCYWLGFPHWISFSRKHPYTSLSFFTKKFAWSKILSVSSFSTQFSLAQTFSTYQISFKLPHCHIACQCLVNNLHSITHYTHEGKSPDRQTKGPCCHAHVKAFEIWFFFLFIQCIFTYFEECSSPYLCLGCFGDKQEFWSASCIDLWPLGVIRTKFPLEMSPLNQTLRSQQLRKPSPTKEPLDW